MREIIIGGRKALQDTFTIMPYEASCKHEQVCLCAGYPTVQLALNPGYRVDNLAREMFPMIGKWEKDDWGYRIACGVMGQLYLWQILDTFFKKFYDQESRKSFCDPASSGFEIRYYKSGKRIDHGAKGYINRLIEPIPGFDLPSHVIRSYSGKDDIEVEHVTKRDETCYIYRVRNYEIGVHCRGSWPLGSWDYFHDYVAGNGYHRKDTEYENQLQTLHDSMLKAKKTLIE